MVSFEQLGRRARERADAQRRKADQITRSVDPKPTRSIRRFGRNKVVDINNLPSMMAQMDDMLEAAAAEASATMMDTAIDVWEGGSNRWPGGEDGRPLFEDGDLINALQPVSQGPVGGIGVSEGTEESGIAFDDLMDKLQDGGIHSPQMKWMALTAEQGEEAVQNAVGRRIVLTMRKFSGLRRF